MEKLHQSSPAGRYLSSRPITSSRVSHFTEHSVIYTDFNKLPMVQRVFALHLACRNLQKTPIIASYSNEVFGKFREYIRSFPFEADTLSEQGQDCYFCIRKAYTFDALVQALGKLEDDSERDLERSFIISRLGGDLIGPNNEISSPNSPRKKASAKEQNQIFELVEDVLKKCFVDCPWTDLLQAEAGSLKQSAEFSRMLDYMDQVMLVARIFPLNQIATATISLLTSLMPSGGSEIVSTESVMRLLGSSK